MISRSFTRQRRLEHRSTSRHHRVGILAAAVTCVAGALCAELTCDEGSLPAEPVSTRARSDFGMAASGSSEATQAAVEILERGGNAIDAAVAAALMLGVADPDASGIGGMTSMVAHLADGRTVVIDGSSPTPRAVDPTRLRPFGKDDWRVGHQLVAVPTTLAVLERARSRFGSMEMADLLAPSIEVAMRGFPVNPVQIIWTNHYLEEISASRYLRLTALADGTTLGRPGDVMCRPDLARTLQHIARHGVSSFYRGPIADLIEADMLRNGGFLRKGDLAMLRLKEERPLHTTYRGTHVLTVPPPGGGVAVIEALNILEAFRSTFLAEDTVDRHHALLEAFRIALADRDLVAGANHSPRRAVTSVMSKDHARMRAGLIVPRQVIPESELYGPIDPECAPKGQSTTQVSVSDRLGNVVSLTQTLGRSWGSKVITPGLGFPYNSLLEGFNYDKPHCPGYLRPHVPCPHNMAPTIVLSGDGSLLVALGSSGSDLIPSIIANVVSNLVDRGMELEAAVAAPRVLFGGGDVLGPWVEVAAPITDAHVDDLEAVGHDAAKRVHFPPTTACAVYFGGVNAVGWDADAMTFVGVGDGRRWGSAKGPRVVADSSTAR